MTIQEKLTKLTPKQERLLNISGFIYVSITIRKHTYNRYKIYLDNNEIKYTLVAKNIYKESTSVHNKKVKKIKYTKDERFENEKYIFNIVNSCNNDLFIDFKYDVYGLKVSKYLDGDNIKDFKIYSDSPYDKNYILVTTNKELNVDTPIKDEKCVYVHTIKKIKYGFY